MGDHRKGGRTTRRGAFVPYGSNLGSGETFRPRRFRLFCRTLSSDCDMDRSPDFRHRGPEPAVTDGRCGCRSGPDRAEYAGFRRLGDGAAGWSSVSRKISAEILADRNLAEDFWRT